MPQQSTSRSHVTRQAGNEPVRVILVEDDLDLKQGLTDFLRLNSFAVTAVGSGKEFDLAFGTDAFDVAIIDVNLPDISGFDIAQRVKKTTNLGIIMLTARTLRDDKLRGYAEGANLYLTKPVDGDELVFAVKNLAERLRQNVKTPKEAPQPTGSWSIDRIGQRLVPPQGKAMKLSGREAALISKLAEESGRIISRAELGLAMGYETILDTRSLDAVLQRLRVKARDAGTELPIQVIHGSGFQLSAKIIFR
ncbi:response regulator transcription factor [Agrobacterium rosae]|uniref:response regulator transcription factor n=1 Tax=Agrobacterium rosae TaxID=1972867 RepID=UPI0019D35C8A|nr:response regulator transcription factor [Agrobacterium rosae]